MHLTNFLILMSDSEAKPDARVPELVALYFDGRHASSQVVSVRIVDGLAQVRHGDWVLELAASQIQWPERTRYGTRSALLPDGAVLQCNDAHAWDQWYSASGLPDSALVRLQQNWAGVASALTILVLLLAVLYLWGLPAVARTVVQFVPYSLDQSLGLRIMQELDGGLMQASELPLAQQESLRAAMRKASASQRPDMLTPWSVEFRKSKIGPNAFALPGGAIVLTDELVKLVDGETDVLTAVFAHELGHLHQRHGIRMLVQVSALGVITGVLWGDFSWAMTTIPAWLGQADYSREVEREADVYALHFLRAAGMDPGAMATMFEKLQNQRKAQSRDTQQNEGSDTAAAWLGIAFASHPADAERIAFFRSRVQ